jgi:hypothetical protein
MMRVEVPVCREMNCAEVGALRGAVVGVENVEEVAIAVVEHAALNLAEADGLPIRVRIPSALAVDANWARVSFAGCAPRHTPHVADGLHQLVMRGYMPA